jgi:hypothetical protein
LQESLEQELQNHAIIIFDTMNMIKSILSVLVIHVISTLGVKKLTKIIEMKKIKAKTTNTSYSSDAISTSRAGAKNAARVMNN